MCSLKGRVAVITGAIGNLGVATAKALQQAGAKTVLVDRSPDRLREAFPALMNSSDHVLAGDVDLTTEASANRMAADAYGRFGRLDVLVNTVGGYRAGKPVHETDLADWDFLLNLNLRTTLLACRAVVPYMLKQRYGKIINVGSRNALEGTPNAAAYSVSKTAVLRLTESLAAELKLSDINVNCILPGTIDTPQNRQAMPQADHSKWVPPEALADVICFLASDGARAITGAAIPTFGKS